MGKYVYGTLYPLLCRTDLIFGNLEEIWEFHADTLLPQLESCHLNPTLIAKTFLEYCQHLTRMYCRSVVNQEYLMYIMWACCLLHTTDYSFVSKRYLDIECCRIRGAPVWAGCDV